MGKNKFSASRNNAFSAFRQFPPRTTFQKLPPAPRYRREYNRPDTAVYSIPAIGGFLGTLSTFETRSVIDRGVETPLPRYHAIVREGSELSDLNALFAALERGETVPDKDADALIGEFIPDVVIRPLVTLKAGAA